MIIANIIVFESLTVWLGLQFNSNFVLDNVRKSDLSFLRIEKTVSKLFEVIGVYCLYPDSDIKR